MNSFDLNWLMADGTGGSGAGGSGSGAERTPAPGAGSGRGKEGEKGGDCEETQGALNLALYPGSDPPLHHCLCGS
jgi:hypothetical protein